MSREHREHSEAVAWFDIGYAASFEWDEDNGKCLWLDWKLYEVVGDDYHISFERAGALSSAERVESMFDAEDIASGFIKWDGCMQFTTGHQHFDDMRDLDNFAESLRRIRDKEVSLGGDADMVGKRDVTYETRPLPGREGKP